MVSGGHSLIWEDSRKILLDFGLISVDSRYTWMDFDELGGTGVNLGGFWVGAE